MNNEMQLRSITIRKFRGLTDVTVPLDPTTVFIGENNSGKTAVLLAVKLALSRGLARRGTTFDEYDYHLADAAASASSAEPIEITLEFGERTADAWAPELLQELGDIVTTSAGGLRSVRLHVTSQFDTTERDFVTEWAFLDEQGAPIGGEAAKPIALLVLIRLVPFFYLSALRDAGREFTDRGSFWGPFVRDPGVPDNVRERIQAALKVANDELLAAHAPLKTAATHLAKLPNVLSGGQTDTVTVDAVPARLTDLLAHAQVNVAGASGLKLPLAQHGAGTQSLSVLFLFEAFADALLARSFGPTAEPLLAIEEPEAHLHPSAVRATWSTLESLPGQKLVATHSGDLLARVPLANVRRCYRRDGAVTVGALQAATLSPEESAKVDFHLKSSRGELLFRRAWLLFEGETEFWLYEGVARLLGVDLDLVGVGLVNYQWCGAEPFVKVARDLGIAWFLAPDGDASGQSAQAKARGYLGTAAEADHIALLPEPTIELFLCRRGYGSVYEAHVAAQKRSAITVAPSDPSYWEQIIDAQDRAPKQERVREVISAMQQAGGPGVPSELRTVIESVVTLARR